MFTVIFWRDALERAIKTAAQSLVVLFTAVEGFDALAIDTATWKAYSGVALGSAAVSVLTSIASASRTGTASADKTVAASAVLKG